MKAAYHLNHMGGVQRGCRGQAEAILSRDIREATCSAGLCEDASKETTSLRLIMPVASAALAFGHVYLATSGSLNVHAQKVA